ncbi:MAG: inorganic triphosphatase [Burkholderiales bacterium PBB1]|nr:MAG: inorganic triphosphatase [Burkholderiales bacterium PBB1]
MKEVELKFQVPSAARKAVESAVAGPQAVRRIHLRAAYFDTPAGALAAAGLALRLRKEGRAWVQTLKGLLPEGGGMTRAEHNVLRAETGAAVPAIDPQLHAGTAVGAALSKVLEDADGALAVVISTDIWRRARTVRVTGGLIELAFDVGRITSCATVPPRQLPVCELEIELKRGHPQAVVATAQRWVARHGLWLDTRSKAELGHLLSRDDAMAQARRAGEVTLSKSMTPAAALQAVLRSCLQQTSVNASQIASGRHVPEHIHQLRVGLRRLRTALQFFDGAQLAEAIDAPIREQLASDAAELFRQLGQARDREAVAEPLAIELARALAAVGLSGEPPALSAFGTEVDPTVAVRQGVAQRLMLTLMSQLQRDSAAAAPALPTADAASSEPLRQRLAQRLTRWHRQVMTDAQAFDTLDDEGRHRLRKRIKRLRYAVEFAASLFDARGVRRYLKVLRALQERLGTVNDVAVGIALYSAALPGDERALFALGWLASQRERALAACKPELKRFVELKRFWRKRGDPTGAK